MDLIDHIHKKRYSEALKLINERSAEQLSIRINNWSAIETAGYVYNYDRNANVIFKELIRKGVDVNSKSHGYSPFLYAFRSGDCEIIEMLLIRGANPVDDFKEMIEIVNHTYVHGITSIYEPHMRMTEIIDTGFSFKNIDPWKCRFFRKRCLVALYSLKPYKWENMF